MLSREEKKKIVSDLTEELKAARGAVFSDFRGLPAKDIQELRALLSKEQVKHKVVKLTLMKLAMRQAGIDVSQFNFTEGLATSWSRDDEIAPARILQNFSKTHENLKIVAGILDRQLIDGGKVKRLAALPSKQELRGRLVGVIAGPLRGLVGVLSGSMRQLVYALNAIKDAKT